MKYPEKGQQWVMNADVQAQTAGEGVQRKVLAFCDGLMCVENTFATGAIGPLHSHPHTQLTYVAKGRFSFTIGDETREVGPGDTLLKQHGVRHGCTCLAAGVLVDVFAPMRQDFL